MQNRQVVPSRLVFPDGTLFRCTDARNRSKKQQMPSLSTFENLSHFWMSQIYLLFESELFWIFSAQLLSFDINDWSWLTITAIHDLCLSWLPHHALPATELLVLVLSQALYLCLVLQGISMDGTQQTTATLRTGIWELIMFLVLKVYLHGSSLNLSAANVYYSC